MVLSLFRPGESNAGDHAASATGSGHGARTGSAPLRLGRQDEPHLADGDDLPSPPTSPAPFGPSNPLTGFLGDLGRSAQAAFAPLRSLNQPLIPPATSPSSAAVGDMLHRDPYAAARERQQQRQSQAEAQARAASATMAVPGGLPLSLVEQEHETPGPHSSSAVSNSSGNGRGRFDHPRRSLDESLPTAAQYQGPSTSPFVHSTGMRKRRPMPRKPKLPPEQLVIVRPPQTKHVHPLNLQIQLVSKRARDRPGTGGSQSSGTSVGNSLPRSSFDSIASAISTLPEDTAFPAEASTEPVASVTSALPSAPQMSVSEYVGSRQSAASGDDLARRTSITSNRSRQSIDTLGSYASGAQSSLIHSHNVRTRVIPLYNLGFHTLLPTVITDAGTDERVAKVTKRGFLELENIGVLEPTELFFGVNDIDTLSQDPSAPFSHTSPTRLMSPDPQKRILEPVQSRSRTLSEAEEEDEEDGARKGSPSHETLSGNLSQSANLTSEFKQSLSLHSKEGSSVSIGPVNTGHQSFMTSSNNESKPKQTTKSAFTRSGANPNSSTPFKKGGVFGRPTSAPADGGNKLVSGFKRLLNSQRNPPVSAPSPPVGGKMGLSRSSTNASHGSADRRMDATRRLSLIRSRPDAGQGSDAGRDPDTASTTTRASLNLSGGDGVPMWPVERKRGGRRALGYIWTIRRWLRPPRIEVPGQQDDALKVKGLRSSGSMSSVRSKASTTASGTLSNVWSHYNLTERAGGHEAPPPARSIPIRIEWTRETNRVKKQRGKESARAAALALLERPRSSIGTHNLSSAALSRSSTSAVSPSRKARLGTMPRPKSAAAQQDESLTLAPHRVHGRGVSLELPGLRSRENSPARNQLAERLGNTGQRTSVAGPTPSWTNARGKSPTSDAAVTPQETITAPSDSGQVESDSDAGESEPDSDPEDSERPWRCALVLGPRTRVPLALLTPAPHHPKLVGQLLIPYPLPNLTDSGLGSDGGGFTSEELKDITMATSLHLVVREGFGTLSRAKR